MSAAPPTTSCPEPHLAAAIARAERRRAMLERLATIGMALAEEIGERNVKAPYHPEPRHDPGRAFAAVSRAVRLTLALEARMDADILAMRNGAAASVFAAAVSPASAPDVAAGARETLSPRRATVRAAVCEVIDHEIGDAETAGAARGRLDERLTESESDAAVLALPFRECVAAICADLGLSPNWSLWPDDDDVQGAEAKPASPAKAGAQCSASLRSRPDELGPRLRGEGDREGSPEQVEAAGPTRNDHAWSGLSP